MISIGLDVGREHDPAALAVLHTAGQREASHRPAWTALEVGNVELGTSYRALAVTACDLATGFARGGYPTVLTVDATGIGAAVVELCREHSPGLHLVAVTIGAGMALTDAGGGCYTVGKHRLSEVLGVALEGRGLTLPDTDGGRALHRQLGAFVRKPNRSGYQRHEAAGVGHDDLVLALELALWTGDTMHDQQAGLTP